MSRQIACGVRRDINVEAVKKLALYRQEWRINLIGFVLTLL